MISFQKQYSKSKLYLIHKSPVFSCDDEFLFFIVVCYSVKNLSFWIFVLFLGNNTFQIVKLSLSTQNINLCNNWLVVNIGQYIPLVKLKLVQIPQRLVIELNINVLKYSEILVDHIYGATSIRYKHMSIVMSNSPSLPVPKQFSSVFELLVQNENPVLFPSQNVNFVFKQHHSFSKDLFWQMNILFLLKFTEHFIKKQVPDS